MKEEIFKSYCHAICQRFNLSYKDLFVKAKVRPVVDARYLLYYMCNQRPMRPRDIQQYMGERGYTIDHTTILYGIKRVAALKKDDNDYKMLIQELNDYVIQP